MSSTQQKSAPEFIHLEKNWAVINKPPGMSVHNQPGKDLISWVESERNTKAFPVHRLDQETSGIIVVAFEGLVATELQTALQSESCHKKYQAILRGKLEAKSEVGTWSWPLTDKAEGRKNPQGLSKDRKNCQTQFKILKTNNYFTFVECEILTGRQHQIRKHAALANHPIVGDSRYNDEKYNDMIESKYGPLRLYLHAFSLQLQLGHKKYDFSCPHSPQFGILMQS